MDKYSMTIKSKSAGGRDVSTTIGYINPIAQPSELKSFAQGLMSLTDNMYVSANRVETVNVDTASDRQVPDVTLYYCTDLTDTSTFVQFDSSVVSIPTSYINSSLNLLIAVGVGTKVFQALPLITLPQGYSIRYSNIMWRADDTLPRFDVSIAMPSNNPQSFALGVKFSETEGFSAWEQAYTISIVANEQGGE